jgi:DNA-binding CsgD family transcriptional regulator/PAS domain-containing protein
MGDRDDVIAAISAIHAAGLDAAKWPDALSRVTRLVGGLGASLEFMERPSLRHSAMYSHGLPSVGAYLDYYATMSPRLPFAARQAAGTVQYDAQYVDEPAMNANPFYMEFLADLDMRYFLGGVIATSPREVVATGVQFSPRQGHPTPAKIKLMALLVPHIQQATDVMRRLGKLTHAQAAFERTLDWLADGVLMLGADGSVHYANVAAQEILRAKDGIAVRRGAIEFRSGDATAKFRATMKAIDHLRDADAAAETMVSDFIVERQSGARSYSISIRPLLGDGERHAAALMFIHDPQVRSTTAVNLLRQAFGLTKAEAEVADALRMGRSPDSYARQCQISPNTVYTHIRRLKEKTGSARMAELIRTLNDVQIAVVAKQATR